MQPTPLVTLHGNVVNVRTVTIPPREATDTSKAYAGGEYVEVTLSTPHAVFGGEVVDGLLAFQTVRLNADDPSLERFVTGAEVTMRCSTFVDVFKVRGRWANSVGFRMQLLDSVSTRALSAAG